MLSGRWPEAMARQSRITATPPERAQSKRFFSQYYLHRRPRESGDQSCYRLRRNLL
jgi:hypothetical protein